jgi:hypothetical protein
MYGKVRSLYSSLSCSYQLPEEIMFAARARLLLSTSRFCRQQHASTLGGESDSANIVLVGAGWWSQGVSFVVSLNHANIYCHKVITFVKTSLYQWHLPHLSRNKRVNISAIVGERCNHIKVSFTSIKHIPTELSHQIRHHILSQILTHI